MDCLRNHGPRMKFRLGHAKVNNPPRSEVISRGATQRRRRREGKKKKKKRQRFSSYSHVLFAGSRGCSEARVSSHQRLLRGRRGKWSSSVRYGLVIPLAISLPLLAFPTPFYTFCYSIFSPFLSRSLASFPVPLLFFIFIYIYISLLLYFLISGRGDERRRRRFLVEAKQRNKRGTNSVSSPFRAQKRVSKLLPDDSTKRRFLLCRKLPKGGALEFGCLHFFLT